MSRKYKTHKTHVSKYKTHKTHISKNKTHETHISKNKTHETHISKTHIHVHINIKINVFTIDRMDFLPCLQFDTDFVQLDAIKPRVPPELNGTIKLFDFGSPDTANSFILCILAELEAEYRHTGDFYLQLLKEFAMKAWKENRLFGLSIEESPELSNVKFLRSEGNTSKTTGIPGFFMFSSQSGYKKYVFPCFLISDTNHCFEGSGHVLEQLWVAPRIRRLGFGKYICSRYIHKFVQNPHSNTLDFWHKIGFIQEVDIDKNKSMSAFVKEQITIFSDELGIP